MLARKWIPILLGLVVVSFIIMILMLNFRLEASILEIAQTTAQMKTIEVINEAVYEKVVKDTEYKDIVYVHKDSDGKIVMLQANTVILNQIMAKTIKAVLNEMSNLESEKIEIPLGQVTGSVLLAGYGPRVDVRIIPTKQINIEVENKFEQAGINQTRHLIYFKIMSRIKIAVPMLNKELNVCTTVPLAETIIVGDVPSTYVDYRGNDDNLYPLIRK